MEEGSAQWRSSRQIIVGFLLVRAERIIWAASWSLVFQYSGLTSSISGYFRE
jgi:hypothetical protein